MTGAAFHHVNGDRIGGFQQERRASRCGTKDTCAGAGFGGAGAYAGRRWEGELMEC